MIGEFLSRAVVLEQLKDLKESVARDRDDRVRNAESTVDEDQSSRS